MKKSAGKYVDGFVLVVPKNKISDYTKIAKAASKSWRKHGALDYKECLIEDAKPKGVTFNFPKMAKLKKNEVVFFSYIVFKSRAHRDAVNKKVMNDASMEGPQDDMSFMDMKRFAYGGFKVVAE